MAASSLSVRSESGTDRTVEARSGVFSALGPAAHVILRVGAGLLFLQHGGQKLFGWFGGFGGQPGATADLFSLMGLAGVLEFFGGLLIAIGLLTRPVGLLLALQMVVAHFMAHQPQGGFPIQNKGELALFYALTFFFFFANGAGCASVDAWIAGRRRG